MLHLITTNKSRTGGMTRLSVSQPLILIVSSYTGSVVEIVNSRSKQTPHRGMHDDDHLHADKSLLLLRK